MKSFPPFPGHCQGRCISLGFFQGGFDPHHASGARQVSGSDGWADTKQLGKDPSWSLTWLFALLLCWGRGLSAVHASLPSSPC